MTQYPQGTTTSCYSCPPHRNIARITPTLHQQKVYLNMPDYNVGFLMWQWHNLANITDVKSVSMVCFRTQACMNWICVKEELTPSTAHTYLSEAGHTLNQVMTSNLSRGKSLPEPTMTYLRWPEGTSEYNHFLYRERISNCHLIQLQWVDCQIKSAPSLCGDNQWISIWLPLIILSRYR